MLLRRDRARGWVRGGVWFVEFELHVGGEGGFGGRLKTKGVPLCVYKAAQNNKGKKRQKLCISPVNKTQKQCHSVQLVVMNIEKHASAWIPCPNNEFKRSPYSIQLTSLLTDMHLSRRSGLAHLAPSICHSICHVGA